MFDFSKYELIIFDYDGVILDSMPYWYHISTEFILHKGKKPKDDLDDTVVYYLTHDVANKFIEEYDLEGGVDEVLKEMELFILDTYPSVKTRPNMKSLLERLSMKKKILFSSSPSKIVIPSLEANNIKDYFNKIYTAKELNISKYDYSGFEYITYDNDIPRDKILILDNDKDVIKTASKYGFDTIFIKDQFNEKEIEEVKNFVTAIYDVNCL